MDQGVGAPESRSSTAATVLWILGAALVAYSILLVITGGIDVTVFGVRIRSRTWQRPALFALASLTIAAVTDKRRVRHFTQQARNTLHRTERLASDLMSARGLALAAVAWAAVAGVVFGTHVAGGADSSGYLNQVRLFARGQILDEQRIDADRAWSDRIFKRAPLGYRPAPDDERLAPVYPPGYPLLMTPAYLISARAPYLIVPICGAVAVWLTFALGRRLGEPTAGVAAALLVSVSPTFLYQVVQPMSDVPAMAAWLLALCLALGRTTATAVFSGLVTGLAILIRPNLAPLAFLIWAAGVAGGGSRDRWRRGFVAAAATMPGIAVVAALQAVRYGSPFASGYGSFGGLFSLSNVGPNLDRYPRWLLESHTPLIGLFLIAPLWIWRRQQEQRAVLMILWTFCLAVVAAYLPYLYFQRWEWTYTRFLLPALPFMWLLALMPMIQFLGARRKTLNKLIAVAALAALMAFSIRTAKVRYAFELKSGERKYAYAADFVQRQLPSNAVILSMQHSGSIWFYTRLPIVRWDYVESDKLDSVVGWLKRNGHAPYVVVDEEEFNRLEDRFRPARQQTLGQAVPMTRFGDVVIYGLR
jgi:hypothetical protein